MADFGGNKGGLGIGVGKHDYSTHREHRPKAPIGQVAVAVGLGLVCTTNAPKTLKAIALAGAGFIGLNASLIWDDERAVQRQTDEAIKLADEIRASDPRRSA